MLSLICLTIAIIGFLFTSFSQYIIPIVAVIVVLFVIDFLLGGKKCPDENKGDEKEESQTVTENELDNVNDNYDDFV